jgi:chromosome segregation ATPase
MNPDIHQAQQELAEQRRSIDEMLHKIKEASRMMDLATHELHKRDARIADLEIECERLRTRLARATETIRRMEEGDL